MQAFSHIGLINTACIIEEMRAHREGSISTAVH
jgi:hypothetical protein